MIINSEILSLPPYLSTPWNFVESIYVEQQSGKPLLVVVLQSKNVVKIPDLSSDTISLIYEMHAKSASTKQKKESSSKENFFPGFENFGDMGAAIGSFDMKNLGAFSSSMQHNSEQANLPDIPKELLDKIVTLSKTFGGDELLNTFPKPEPHCNCMHCQLAKAIHSNLDSSINHLDEENSGEEVSDEELQFRTWDIKQIGEKLYEVINPLDESEHYQVFLGKPLGCTCGEKNCEHMRAVLNS